MTDSADTEKRSSRSLKPLAMLWPFIQPYRGTLMLALVALVVASAAVLSMPFAVRDVIDQGFTSERASDIDRYFLALLGFAVIIGLFGAARAYFVSWLGERVVADLRDAVFRKVIEMDPTFFENTKVGEILSRLTTDTTLIQSISGVGVSIVLRSSIQLIGALVLLVLTNWVLTLYLLVLLPVVIAPVMAIGHWLRRLSRATQDRVADLSGLAGESLNAVETVQVFNAQHRETHRFQAAVEVSFLTAIRRIRVRALLTTVAMTGLFGAFIVVLWLGAKAVLAEEMTAGTLGQFVIYAVLVGASGSALIEFFGELQRAAGAMERLGQLLLLTPDIRSVPQPREIPMQAKASIQFEGVSFSYPSRPDRKALDRFNLTISPGEKIAFVGASGAGKTTLFKLLLRLYDVGEGVIRINGTDIRSADLERVRALIGVVPQENPIFGLTATDNIRFGREDATPEMIANAARIANADAFIRGLPEGYDTFLGERGARLSGGQKQRIALARAIVRDPPILLLDEATSALDVENERLVQQALTQVESGRTTLIIAHRLSTVLHADRIVLMQDGRIEAIGSHAQLMETSDSYREMVALQFDAPSPLADLIPVAAT
ncbi:MAG: ABC transporter transmembrane domain-containing protein [Pseudomonadales bacterium]